MRLKVLELGAYDSVVCFNKKSVERYKVLELLGMEVGRNTVNGLQSIDHARIAKAEKAIDDLQKLARKPQPKRKMIEKDEDTEEYGCGLH